jgi:hypothetical protein
VAENSFIVRAVRIAIALLLLIAAAFHPLAHTAEDAVVCPCVHAVVAELPPPASAGLRFLAAVAPAALPAAVLPVIADDIAPRGPPVA